VFCNKFLFSSILQRRVKPIYTRRRFCVPGRHFGGREAVVATRCCFAPSASSAKMMNILPCSAKRLLRDSCGWQPIDSHTTIFISIMSMWCQTACFLWLSQSKMAQDYEVLGLFESFISTWPEWSGLNVLYQACASSERANWWGWPLIIFTWFIGSGGGGTRESVPYVYQRNRSFKSVENI